MRARVPSSRPASAGQQGALVTTTPSPQVLSFGQDLPAGNYAALRRQGTLPRSNTAREYWAAARNYRTWVVCILYGFSFGVELTMNNGGWARLGLAGLVVELWGVARSATAVRRHRGCSASSFPFDPCPPICPRPACSICSILV